MKNILLLTLFIVHTSQFYAQTLTFDNLNANSSVGKSITWDSSEWGAGFGHRIINSDHDGQTFLDIEGRHNTANWSKLLSISSNGNIGIGTTTPDQALVVKGSISFDYGDNKSYNGFRRDGIKTEYYNIITGGIGIIHEFTGSKGAILSLTNNGNAALNGKFAAKEIKVSATPTADFVFEKDYDLPTLDFIEKHIKEKKHLPEIAAAKEMEKNGVNIGEFQIQLLQKIEELTLYTIAQEKQIKELNQKEERNRNLENRLAILEALVFKTIKTIT